MTLTAIGSFLLVFDTGNLFALVGILIFLIQFSCLFMPMYGYRKEYEKLKELSVAEEYEKLKELSVAQEMESGDKQNLEMV
eukprot:CAMPEP_0113630648 /NCGR_PEP_ID=MMETSP0017_2-20120614/15926_1 /TAXON_ID=2856 /ORGANISM="Cylindrotheca closterium" /LENGTH=80 /DNA_ID=CAMNT_0000541125 /DNA_START=70 /DNA_END=312 /DNA_ORIENTATION=- /assembly_acc=CAM_ASM_000147